MNMTKMCGTLLFLLFLTAQLLGLTTVLSENFSGLTVSGGSTDISSQLDSKLQTTGWTGSKIYENAGEAKMGNSSTAGYIITRTVDLSAASGAAILQFDTRYYGTDTGKYIQVFHASNGTTFTQVGSDIATTATMTTVTVNISGGTASSKIKIAAKLDAANRYYLDNFILTQATGTNYVPTVATATITDIASTTATSGGTITSDGGVSVTERGVCWNTTGTPVITNSHTSDGTGTGTFISSITGLTAATTYYVRAFATNSVGTGYGAEISFTTSGGAPPSAPVSTAASSITGTSFAANWNVVSGATSYLLDVSTNSSFSSFVTGYNNLPVATNTQSVSNLSVSTTYYYRVRAVNINGTSANSNTISVTTTASDPFNGYYNPVTGLSGTTLKTALHTLIATNTNTDYSGSKLFMFQTADNVSGTVRCVYTGYDYTVSSSYDGATDPNTEHTFAQSWFGTTDASIKKADIHHLFPTNATVNSTRSNYPFDEVTSITYTSPSYNGYVSYKGTNSSGQTVFEPADQHKGDCARALLYFSVRYNMSLSIDGVDMLPTMISWNSQDPPDTKELARNASIYSFMGNRNPFVDHPEYVSSIWGGTVTNTLVSFNPASAIVNENAGTVTLTVTIENPSSTAATSASITLTDGTAADVGNYTTQTVTFPAGSSTSKTVTLNITDDALVEGNETLVFSLTSISGGTSAMAGSYDTFNLTINDNDLPTVTALAASNVAITGFSANWNTASGITTYEFDLSASSDFSSFVTGYNALQVTGTTISITGLTAGTTYYYRLRTFINDTVGANSNTIITTLALPTAPAVTASLDASSIVLSWLRQPQISLVYRVEAADNPYGTFNDITLSGTFNESGGIVSWTSDLLYDKKFYRVIAVTATK